MGKGNRNNLKRSQESVENAEKYLAREKSKAKKSKFDKLIAVAVIALVAVIVLTLALSVMSEAGLFLRMQNGATAGEISVDGAMMTFFMNDYIMNWYTNSDYSYYVGYFSLDLTRDLRLQKYGDSSATGYAYETSFLGSFKGTWYDYFWSLVKEETEMYIIYANAAKANGITITDEDKAEIEETLKGIDTNLNSLGVSYADWYGTGVNKGVARRCYELKYLAANFAEKLQADLEAEAEKNQDGIVDYREEHKETFYTADCLTYTISKTSKGMTDEAFDNAVKAAKEAADKIAAAKTPAEFVELVEKYESESKAADKTEATTTTKTETTSAKTETGSEETETTDPYEKYKEEIKYETETGTNADNKLNDFLFGNEETGTDAVEPAEKNDAIVIEETGTTTEKVTTTTKKETATTEANKTKSATDSETESATETASKAETETKAETEKKENNGVITHDTYKVTVYFVYEPMHYETELTHSFSYLVSDSKDAIANFIEKFKANETKDLDAFIEVAEKMYEEIHADEDHNHSSDEMFVYDKLEKQAANAFNTSYKVLNEWVESADRKAGDISEPIEIKITSTDSTTNKVTTKTQYGVIFFKEHNGETWYETAKAGLVYDMTEDWYEAQRKANPVEFGNMVDSIETAKPFLALLGY